MLSKLVFCLLATVLLSVGASPVVAGAKKPKLAQVITKCVKKNTAALTFDDGPSDYILVRAYPWNRSARPG